MASGVGGSRRLRETGLPFVGIMDLTSHIPILSVLQPQKESTFSSVFPKTPQDQVLLDTLDSTLTGQEITHLFPKESRSQGDGIC